MADKLRRTRITINTRELTLITKLQCTTAADCPQCEARVEMATPEQAVTLTGIPSRQIYGWVESGQLHFLETAEGHLLICLDSLRAHNPTRIGRAPSYSLLSGESEDE